MANSYDAMKEFAQEKIDQKKLLSNDEWFAFNETYDINIYNQITPDSRTVIRADAYERTTGNRTHAHQGNAIRLT